VLVLGLGLPTTPTPNPHPHPNPHPTLLDRAEAGRGPMAASVLSGQRETGGLRAPCDTKAAKGTR